MRIDLSDTKKIEDKIAELCEISSIKQKHKTVSRLINLMLKKANNNLKLAKTIFNFSDTKEIREVVGLGE